MRTKTWWRTFSLPSLRWAGTWSRHFPRGHAVGWRAPRSVTRKVKCASPPSLPCAGEPGRNGADTRVDTWTALCVVRTDALHDHTEGFFLALFVRSPPTQQQQQTQLKRLRALAKARGSTQGVEAMEVEAPSAKRSIGTKPLSRQHTTDPPTLLHSPQKHALVPHVAPSLHPPLSSQRFSSSGDETTPAPLTKKQKKAQRAKEAPATVPVSSAGKIKKRSTGKSKKKRPLI